MAKEKDASVDANEVAAAITEGAASVAAKNAPEDEPNEEKLDARAALFVRQVSDAVTKSIADILQGSATQGSATQGSATQGSEPEPEPEPRKRRKQSPSILDLLLRPLI